MSEDRRGARSSVGVWQNGLGGVTSLFPAREISAKQWHSPMRSKWQPGNPTVCAGRFVEGDVICDSSHSKWRRARPVPLAVWAQSVVPRFDLALGIHVRKNDRQRLGRSSVHACRRVVIRRSSGSASSLLRAQQDGNYSPAGLWVPAQSQNLVGASGFEPPASWSRTRRSTRLSHAPTRTATAP